MVTDLLLYILAALVLVLVFVGSVLVSFSRDGKWGQRVVRLFLSEKMVLRFLKTKAGRKIAESQLDQALADPQALEQMARQMGADEAAVRQMQKLADLPPEARAKLAEAALDTDRGRHEAMLTVQEAMRAPKTPDQARAQAKKKEQARARRKAAKRRRKR